MSGLDVNYMKEAWEIENIRGKPAICKDVLIFLLLLLSFLQAFLSGDRSISIELLVSSLTV